MSDDYSIGCTQCKKTLWIGQSANSRPPFCLYYGEESTMLALRNFLWEHRTHPLCFDDSQHMEWEEPNPDDH